MAPPEQPMKFRFVVTVEVITAEDQNPGVDGPLLRQALYDAAFECMDRPEGAGLTVQLITDQPDRFGYVVCQVEPVAKGVN